MTWHSISKVHNAIKLCELERRIAVFDHKAVDVALDFLAAVDDFLYLLIKILVPAFQKIVQLVALHSELAIDLVRLRFEGVNVIIDFALQAPLSAFA